MSLCYQLCRSKSIHSRNYIKFHFLFLITERLLNGIEDLKKALAYKYSNLSENTEDVNAQIESYVVAATRKFPLVFAYLFFHS